MEIPQLYKVVRRYPIWEKANLDYIYYPRFSINLIVIRIECTLENLEILLFGAQTRFKIVIFTREGDWYRDIYPRHPLYLRPCRSRRRFVWISLTVSRTRHGGWKRKKHRPTACSSGLQLATANERAVTCKVYRRSSVFNEEWLKAWSFYRGTFFPPSRFREERKKKKKKKGEERN